MKVKVVKCQGIFRPETIMPAMDSPPPDAPPTSGTNSTALKYESLNITGSSRDGWSPARIRAADAEAWAFQEAADRIEEEESAAWAKHTEGPEPGATDHDMRIYTDLGNGEYRYWGVKDLDMTMEEFWARIDPENTRERSPDNPPGPLPGRNIPTSIKSPSPPHTSFRSKRRGKAPEFNLKNRVAKPNIVTPASKKGIRKSLASKIEGRGSEIFEQSRILADNPTKEPTVPMNPWGTERPDEAERPQTISGVKSSMSTLPATKKAARGRPRKTQPDITDSSPPKTADWLMSRAEDPPKRKRGRPAKEKQPKKSHEPNKKQERPEAENKAKVTKSKLKMDRLSAPSLHKMRTRARGPAENI